MYVHIRIAVIDRSMKQGNVKKLCMPITRNAIRYPLKPKTFKNEVIEKASAYPLTPTQNGTTATPNTVNEKISITSGYLRMFRKFVKNRYRPLYPIVKPSK